MKDAALDSSENQMLSSSDKVNLYDWGLAILEEPNSKEVK